MGRIYFALALISWLSACAATSTATEAEINLGVRDIYCRIYNIPFAERQVQVYERRHSYRIVSERGEWLVDAANCLVEKYHPGVEAELRTPQSQKTEQINQNPYLFFHLQEE